MTPSLKQSALLKLVIANDGRMSHDNSALNPYCDDGEPDTFNACHHAGWLKTWRDEDYSAVEITKAGRAILVAEDTF